ncbi:outer membrane murein-binding lipoprotein Lpp [Mycetocola sp. CAN_C7]|uniref:hypothetical protein n=1 Tax=Mycetocola sp. CAN_C7 TaxID=2787724 RepID=UPI0018C8E5FE
MPRNRFRTASVLGVVAVGGLLLTGCAGGQSTADACSIVQTTMVQAQEDLSASVAEFGNDPEAGATAVDDLATAFSDANGKISNTEVKTTTDKAEKALDAFAAEMEKAAADQANVDSDALTDALGDIETTFTDVQEVCGA